MDQNIFKIKRAFLIPFIILIILLCILFLLSLYKGQPWEKIILAVSLFITVVIGIESSKREITVTKDGLKIKKFFRVKKFTWPEITRLEVVDIRKKVYFLLTTTRGFYFFSNLFENHTNLIRSLMDKLGDEKTEIEVRSYLDHPVEKRSLIIMCWLSVIIITAFIIMKLFLA